MIDASRALKVTQALLRKTVANGCTPSEATAAADRGAAYMQRFGFTLEEATRGVAGGGAGGVGAGRSSRPAGEQPPADRDELLGHALALLHRAVPATKGKTRRLATLGRPLSGLQALSGHAM